MAGRARTNAILDTLEARRSAHFDADPEPTTLDYLTEWVANGNTVKALAQSITDDLGFDVWAESLMRILRKQYGEERLETALRSARARASHSYAEDAIALVDQADGDSSSRVSKAAHQARSRQWMAEKLNPETFGQKQGANVHISIGALHLDALKATPKGVTVGLSSPESGQISDGGSLLQVADTPLLTATQEA